MLHQDDPEEQRETGEYLICALDEQGLADRQLFPPDLRGVTYLPESERGIEITEAEVWLGIGLFGSEFGGTEEED